MTLLMVISGGQTGVDIAALRAAKACGIPTGGWMPKGWRTLDGPRPEYQQLYDMLEAPLYSYADRTVANVYDSDATLRLASDWSSAGERCTHRAIVAAARPYLDITIHPDPSGDWYAPQFPGQILEWLQGLRGDVILNVAGNSEQTVTGIERTAEALLRRVFAEAVGQRS